MATSPVIVDEGMEQSALTTVERALAILVITPALRTSAAEIGKVIAVLDKEAEEWFAPMKRSAAAAHKAICERENSVRKPLDEAKRYLSNQIGSFDQEQERIRLAEEARLRKAALDEAQAEARRIADERAVQDAIELERAGDIKGAEAVLANPVPVPVIIPPPVVLPTTVPKTAGVSTFSNWDFVIEDENLVPREYLMLDEKKIRSVVKAMKEKTTISGIRAYDKGGTRFKT